MKKHNITEKNFIRKYRKSKIFHIALIAAVDIAFFVGVFINFLNGELVFEIPALRTITILFLILLIFNIFFVFYDIYNLRIFLLEAEKLNRLAYLDELTGIPNRHGLDLILAAYSTPKSIENLGCAYFSITNLYNANDHVGKYAGDLMIQIFSSILDKIGNKFGNIGRNGGNEFITLIDNCSQKKMKDFIAAVDSELEIYNSSHPDLTISVHSNFVLNQDINAQYVNELIIAALKR